jgi:hypothetical protein
MERFLQRWFQIVRRFGRNRLRLKFIFRQNFGWKKSLQLKSAAQQVEA